MAPESTRGCAAWHKLALTRLVTLVPDVSAEPIHLRPTAPLAERVLLPGDPGRALLLAQSLLQEPRMFNHHRGLWGYTGTAADEKPLTIQSTGMGGPSAAIVITELATLGAHRLIRVGTCGGLDPTLELGDIILAREAIANDGTSKALGATARVEPHQGLTNAIADSTPNLHQGPIISTDLFYDNRDRERHWASQGALAIEMETATLFTIAAKLKLEAAALLIVTDLILPTRQRISPDALTKTEHRIGEIATRGLMGLGAGAGPRSSPLA
jgi:DeoD family purine-nucleoside phosphorylase